MRILVTGATGFIGQHIVRGLLAAGHQVTAAVRDPEHARLPDGVTRIQADFDTDHAPALWLPRLAGIEAVINAVGIIHEARGQRFGSLHRDAPVALFEACARAGVRRVVQISALGADAEAASAYHLTKRAADEVLSRLDLDWVILRPSIVHGPGARSHAFFQALAALPLLPLVDGGRQIIRPIRIDDLVRAVTACIEPAGPVRQRIDAVGGEEIRLVDYLALLRRSLGGGPLRVVNVPYGLAHRLAGWAGRLGGGLINADTVAMLQRENTAPVEPFEAAFGFRPRGASELLAQPAGEADRWHARLLFVKPLLRITLGFMWVWAGVTSAALYPHEESYALLAATGIEGVFAPVALYGAALLDAVLGVALCARYRIPLVAVVQIIVIIGYTAIISVALPELWLHPFGPVAKNLPLLAATLAMLALDQRR